VTALIAASSSTKTTTANPIVSLLPLVLIFGLAYVFFLRPRAQAARRQRDTLMELSAGDEVLTAAGIFGTVLDVEADRVTLETAPGTRITVLRSTIARKLGDPVDATPSWDEHDEDEAHGAYHDYEHSHEDDEDEAHAEHDEAHAEHDGAEAESADADDEHTADEHAADEHAADEHTADEHTAVDEHEDDKGADNPGDHKT
jgi:preprotein translocase subunit YajC